MPSRCRASVPRRPSGQHGFSGSGRAVSGNKRATGRGGRKSGGYWREAGEGQAGPGEAGPPTVTPCTGVTLRTGVTWQRSTGVTAQVSPRCAAVTPRGEGVTPILHAVTPAVLQVHPGGCSWNSGLPRSQAGTDGRGDRRPAGCTQHPAGPHVLGRSYIASQSTKTSPRPK